jgi:hypothetical protein
VTEPDRVVEPAEEPPPPLGSWPRLYALVIAELAAFVLLLAWLTRRFS